MKYSLLILLMMLAPIVAVAGYTDNAPVAVIEPEAINSPVGVLAGDTLKYDIDALTIPGSPEDVTLPDFSGNQIFMKILNVNDSEILPDGTGTFITYAVGLMFLETETITINPGDPLEQVIAIPSGSATPSITLEGVPRFDGLNAPTVFFINDDWASHEAFFTGMGMTVTNGATDLEVLATNGTGTISGNWRKSDGVLTHILFDDIYWMGLNATGVTIELSLASKEYKPLAVTVGQTLELDIDAIDIGVSGSGTLFSMLNTTIVDEINDQLDLLEGETMLRFVVDDIAGCYVRGRGYMYNFSTGLLDGGTDQTVFNGFLGCYQTTEPPMYVDGYMGGIWAPAITPDWDIYAAQMKLYNYGLTEYMDYIFATPMPEDALTINSVGANFELTTNGAFKFFQVGISANVDQNMTNAFTSPIPPAVYDQGINVIAELDLYTCFHETGIAAAIKVSGTISAEFYTTNITLPSGTVVLDFNFKLRNPNYNPPEPSTADTIPGFTWLIAIPALFGIAAFAFIARKRK
ncbi:MAG: hypothetical protein ACTSO7_10765 [Candidatus Heimdallarchaeota archaeon]